MERQSTQAPNFTLLFESVMSSGGDICLYDHSRNKESNVRIAVDDSAFSYRIQREFPSIIADLIDLAVAIHAADRLTFQSLRQQQTRIHVVLPVRHPEILNKGLSKISFLVFSNGLPGADGYLNFLKELIWDVLLSNNLYLPHLIPI